MNTSVENFSPSYWTNTRKKTSIKVELVFITPSVAENYLKFNDKNRKPSERHVKFLSNQMKDGFFIENGETIVFDTKGQLKDGQHRLLAIVKSGMSYHIPVVRGVEPKSMATFDTGKNRTAADVLTINGFKYGAAISSFSQSVNKFLHNSRKSGRSYAANRFESLTNQQVLDYCTENYDWIKDLVKTSILLSDKSKPRVLTSSQIALISYIIGGETPSDKVYSFIKNLIGIIRSENTATSYIYTKLYNSKVNKEPLNFYWVLGMTIKSWNYYIDGNPAVKYFKFSANQELPKINK